MSFIREHRDAILNAWAEAVLEFPAARRTSRARLIDHLPELLDRIEDAADRQLDERLLPHLDESSKLEEVIAEYAILRDCMLRLWAEAHAPDPRVLRALNGVVDAAMHAAAAEYAQSRERTLEGLDRIASAAFESHDLEELLVRLLGVLIETVPAVDTAAILLREGNQLVVRTAVGLEAGLQRDFRLALGEGFAGTIAATRRPLALSGDSVRALVRSPALRQGGVRVLFGVPLIAGGALIGVASMGSLTARQFSGDDRRVFTTMASRATSFIQMQLLRDAAEQRTAEMRSQEALTRTLLENVTMPLFMVDARGVATYLNPAAERLTGFTLADLGTDTLHDRTHYLHSDGSPFPRSECPLARAFVEGRALIDQEDIIVRRDGAFVPVVYSVTPFPGGAVLEVRDVTERKAALERLKDAVRLRENILSVVSHDLRNPLGAIHMSAAALKRDGTYRANYVDTILRSSTRMERLISDLLDMTRIRDGRLTLDLGTYAVADLLHEALEMHQPLAQDKGVTLQAASADPCQLWCDRERVLQVISNLVGNALSACRARDAITLEAHAERERCVLSVIDTGPGIPPEQLPHVFEPYFSRPRGGNSSGTGLGLGIARGIVEAHGGQIWIDSAVGHGTTVHFSLPVG